MKIVPKLRLKLRKNMYIFALYYLRYSFKYLDVNMLYTAKFPLRRYLTSEVAQVSSLHNLISAIKISMDSRKLIQSMK
ncbi:Thymidylate synthase [Dirofilaria immitis]